MYAPEIHCFKKIPQNAIVAMFLPIPFHFSCVEDISCKGFSLPPFGKLFPLLRSQTDLTIFSLLQLLSWYVAVLEGFRAILNHHDWFVFSLGSSCYCWTIAVMACPRSITVALPHGRKFWVPFVASPTTSAFTKETTLSLRFSPSEAQQSITDELAGAFM